MISISHNQWINPKYLIYFETSEVPAQECFIITLWMNRGPKKLIVSYKSREDQQEVIIKLIKAVQEVNSPK